MLSFSKPAAGLLKPALFLLFASVMAHASVVTVDPTVTNNAGLYTYAYSISYTGADDLFLLDIPVATDPSAVTNIMTPAGFTWQFDSVNGLVSFLENGSFFTSTPASGFSFDSSIAPSDAVFSASVADSNFEISAIGGTTMAPTPEPTFFYLLALIAPVMLLYQRRTKTIVNGDLYVSNSK